MKRTAMLITATLLACTVGATGVWAAGPGRSCRNRTCTTEQCRFVDEDGDGICDNCTDGITGRYYTDENGDGICDYRIAAGCRGGGRAGGCRA